MSYPQLLSPGRIGALELRNRVVMPPLRTRLSHVDGTVSPREIAFFAARARGGAALVNVGSMLVATEFEAAQPKTTRIDDDRFVPGLSRLVDAVHDAGARIGAQLTVGAGRAGGPEPGRQVPVSASDNSWGRNPVATCRALTAEEITALVERFRAACQRAAAAGFDLIDIHARVGHLVDQFLSPVWNRRTDRYGGALANRARLATELVAAARDAAPGLAVSVRISVNHHIPGGRELSESVAIAQVLQSAGVDLIVTDDGAPESMHRAVPPQYLGDAPGLESAVALRKALIVPVLATGSIPVDLAEKTLAEGAVDLIGMARPLIADPELAAKLSDGGAVRPCVRCNTCMGNVSTGLAVACAVNPEAGFELAHGIQPAPRAKRVVVVGGGPAGLETARIAALRGHTVDLYEKAAALGGVLRYAASSEFKKELRALVDWWDAQLRRLGVTVHLGRELSASSPPLRDAEEVVIATGGLPIRPVEISGLDRENVVDVAQAHNGARLGHRVVVAGGGSSGADTALQLALAGHEVTLLEQLEEIATDLLEINRTALLRRLVESGATVLTGRTVRAIDDGGVLADGPDGRIRVAADTVVTAFGTRPNTGLVGSDSQEDPRVHVVGDCAAPADVGEAVHAAFLTAINL